MADWDDEGFEPGEVIEKKGDAWEGEDEEDDELKENWDDEEEDKDKPVETESSPVVAVPVAKKKKSTVKKKILEKEEKMKEELLRKAEMKEQEVDEDDDEESIFASELETKLKNKKLQEESDLNVAKELFGGLNIDETTKSIDTFKPTNKEEFNELAKMLADKLSQFETSIEYPGFLEVLLRDLASGMEADDVKKLASVLNILASEKQKAQKGGKPKKKMKKVLGGGAKGTKGVDIQDYGDVYDDFM